MHLNTNAFLALALLAFASSAHAQGYPNKGILMVVPLATAVPQIKEGHVRALGVTGAKRAAAVPDVPTVAEQGVPGFASSGWQAWFMPANTPAAIVERIQQEIVKAIAHPDVRARLEAMAYEPIGSTPTQFDTYFKSEIAKFTKVIADAKIPQQ